MMVQGGAWAATDVAGLANDDEAETPAAAESPAPAAESLTEAKPATKSTKAASASKKSRSRIISKRSRSSSGALVVGHVVPEDRLRTEAPVRPSGNVHLYSLSSHESLKVNIYNPDGSYNIEALDAVSHLLRCKRTDSQKAMEPRLLTLLSHVYDHFGERRIEIVSGYRNQRRTSSYHYRGSATDIRVDGVDPKKVRAFVESLDAGGMGVGYYPRTKFVHVDVRPPPSYRWIDWSRSDPDAPDKRPPRKTVRRKKLQS